MVDSPPERSLWNASGRTLVRAAREVVEAFDARDEAARAGQGANIACVQEEMTPRHERCRLAWEQLRDVVATIQSRPPPER